MTLERQVIQYCDLQLNSYCCQKELNMLNNTIIFAEGILCQNPQALSLNNEKKREHRTRYDDFLARTISLSNFAEHA